MKKVLMITQYFPPAGGVGTFRVTKFVKYLRDFGWEPVVLTVNKECYPKSVWLDYDLEKDIPKDLHIYKTNIWNSKIINDEGIRWLPFLLSNILKIIRKEQPNLIYVTGGPFFSLIMAPVIRLFFHLPYVVDLRDPWRLARRGTHIHGLKAHLGELLTNIAEPIVLRYSAKVICVSEYMCKEYREVYSYLPSQKFVVITNGYDPDDFATIEPIYFAEFTIVYTGKFRTAEALRDPTHFFYALKILKEHNLKVRFVHIGMKEEEVLNIAKQIKILELIEVIGPCPYKKTLSYAKGSNLLLLIAGGQKTEQTGKIFDYIGCSRPILALASPNGEIAKIVKKIYNARLIKNNDPEAIAMIIKEMLYENQKVVQTKIVQRKYYRRNLTNKLSSVFEEVYVRTGRIIKQ